MSYSIPDCFMIAFFCGTAFGLVYELFRVIRRCFPLKAVTFLCDISFFILAAFLVFNISLYLGNYVRMYTILGFGAGVFTYIQTLGRLFSAIESAIGSCLKSFVRTLSAPIRAFAHTARPYFRKINDFFTASAKKAFSLLHFNHQKLYNKKRNITTSIDERNNGEILGGKNVIHAKIYRSK